MVMSVFKKHNCNKKTEDKEFELTSNSLKSLFSRNEDVIFREILINGIKVNIVYIDGLVDSTAASDFLIKPLKQEESFKSARTEKEIIKLIDEGNVYFIKQKKRMSEKDVVSDILNGNITLVFDEEKTAFTFEMYGFDKRSITEPTGENSIKGSKDSFVETLRTNTATVRRRIKSRDLRVESVTIGQITKTKVDIFYLDGIANKAMIEELKNRLGKIDEDIMLATGFLEEYIIDHKYVSFPQIIYTQRPDRFCADIVEGRVGVIVDGLPDSFIVPATLLQCLQAVDDYSQDFIISSVLRMLRFFLMLITLILPSFFIAISNFHQGLIPGELAVFMKASKEGVPFPTFMETVFMLIAFEILTEAGIRLPKTIGQTVSVVGAVIIGQAAVNARLVSPTVVIVIALTAISGYAMPNQDFSNALRLWRAILVVLSSLTGLFGVFIGAFYLLMILCCMECFGVPYLSPFVTTDYRNLGDSIIRLPLPWHTKRPLNLKVKDVERR